MKEINGDHLYSFFLDNGIIPEEDLDTLRYDVFGKFYYYGDHFKANPEDVKVLIKKAAIKMLHGVFYLANLSTPNTFKKKIISNAYFNLNEDIRNLDFDIFSAPWQFSGNGRYIWDGKLLVGVNKFISKVENSGLGYFVSGDFFQEFSYLKELFSEFYLRNEISALIVPNDVSMFENLSIRIFKNLEKPSFVFLHGLPGRYNIFDENRSKYLVVWGDKIKANYINTGFSPDKIFVSGHPILSKLKIPKHIRSDLGKVLVLTQSIPGKKDGSNTKNTNRSTLLYYLFSIEKVLKSLGVNKCRLRCHPAENINWYLNNINSDFFRPDTNSNIKNSLLESTLVIGPVSSVIFESFFSGVNFVVYEPTNLNGVNILNKELSTIIDLNDPRVPIALEENDLKEILIRKNTIDSDIVSDYIHPDFNIDFLKELI